MEGWGGLTHQLAQDYGQGQDVMQSPSGPPLLSHYSAPLRPRDSLSAHRDALSQLARLSLGSRQGFSPGTGFEDATHSPQVRFQTHRLTCVAQSLVWVCSSEGAC